MVLGSGIRENPIPDPGSRGQKGTGSRIRIRNTVCDNLSSHVSLEVISLCRENNIEYVCLLPNSTDKMQPLDVGIFGPMNPIILFPSLSKQ